MIEHRADMEINRMEQKLSFDSDDFVWFEGTKRSNRECKNGTRLNCFQI